MNNTLACILDFAYIFQLNSVNFTCNQYGPREIISREYYWPEESLKDIYKLS